MDLKALTRRAPTIRQWLAMLGAALIVPAALAVVILFVHSYQRERTAAERAAVDVARALMQAIDREHASAEGALQALATSPNLDRGDLEAFRRQAVEVLHYRPGNVLVLADDRHRQRVNTHLPFGAALPPYANSASQQAVFMSGRPQVSDLHDAEGKLLTSVDVPVIRAGRVIYVLSMQYFGERLGSILLRQKILPGASASIYDGNGRLVWRSPGSARDVGKPAASALAKAIARYMEGSVDAVGGDAVRRVTVFSRSSISRWVVAIELSRSALNASLWGPLLWIGLGTLALFALGVVLVRTIGARIEVSIRGLVRPAIALGYGAPVALPALYLREAKEVGRALVRAATLLRERTIQRDEAARAEHKLREANREIERSEAFLRGVFEETPDGVLLVGRDSRVTRANAQAERLFSHEHGAMAGLPIDALLSCVGEQPLTVAERIHAAVSAAHASGLGDLHGRRGDGSTFPAAAMVSPLRESALAIVTVRDTTASWEKEQALQSALADKDTLLKELYHRVKNNLQLLISLFNLQVRMLAEPRARQALLDASGTLRAMALLHERLYQSRSLSSVTLDGYISELCDQLAGATAGPQRGIVVRLEAEPVEVGIDVAVPVGLLLNELVSNSLKHAFPDGRGGTIVVRIARTDDETMRLSVRDDGVGLPPDIDRTSSQTLGLKLISALSAQLRAQFSLVNAPDGRGALAELVFRIPSVATEPVSDHAADAA